MIKRHIMTRREMYLLLTICVSLPTCVQPGQLQWFKYRDKRLEAEQMVVLQALSEYRCKRACENRVDRGCRSVSYNKQTAACYLNSESPLTVAHVTSDDHYNLHIYCTKQIYNQDTVWERSEGAFYGHNYHREIVSNVEACQQLCRQDPLCVSVEIDSSNECCLQEQSWYSPDNIQIGSWYATYDGWTHYTYCPAVLFGEGFDVVERSGSVTYQNGRISGQLDSVARQHPGRSRLDCIYLCSTDTDCQGFSYDNNGCFTITV